MLWFSLIWEFHGKRALECSVSCFLKGSADRWKNFRHYWWKVGRWGTGDWLAGWLAGCFVVKNATGHRKQEHADDVQLTGLCASAWLCHLVQLCWSRHVSNPSMMQSSVICNNCVILTWSQSRFSLCVLTYTIRVYERMCCGRYVK